MNLTQREEFQKKNKKVDCVFEVKGIAETEWPQESTSLAMLNSIPEIGLIFYNKYKNQLKIDKT